MSGTSGEKIGAVFEEPSQPETTSDPNYLTSEDAFDVDSYPKLRKWGPFAYLHVLSCG
jgi:hypothetical protein